MPIQTNDCLDEAILDTDIPILDTHHHLFDRPGLRYMLDDYLADVGAGHRIVASVYVETLAFARDSGPEMSRTLGEVEFANGVGAMASSGVYGDCQVSAAIVGSADLRFGAKIGEVLDQAISLAPARFRGIRQITIEHPSETPYKYITHRPPSGILQHPEFRTGFGQLEKRGLSFDAAVFHNQLPDIAALADAFPHTRIILNHTGLAMCMEMGVAERAAACQEWDRNMRDLAKRPNVQCKVGGLGMPFWGFGFEHRKDKVGYLELATAWAPFVEVAIDAFGVDRCMMESNFPPDKRSCGFVPLWNALKHLVRDFSVDEKTALFSRTGAKAYGIDLTRTASSQSLPQGN